MEEARVSVVIEATSQNADKEIKKTTDALKELQSVSRQKVSSPLPGVEDMNEVEALTAKLGFLRIALEKALNKGETSSAVNYQLQILRIEKTLDKAAQTAEGTAAAFAKVVDSAPSGGGPLEGIADMTKVDVLQTKLTSLRAAMEEAISGGDTSRALEYRLQIIRTEEALEKMSHAAKKAASSTKEVGDAAKSTKRPLATFIASLKRIAYYRVVRSIIKTIGQAFAEGMKNAYLFSQGVVGESHRFAEAMDNLKSATSRMKSELGAAFLGLLTAIMPVLLQLINILTIAANAINQFFAALTGSRYLRANDVTERFAENTAKGAKAAKEWKNQLLGFDEINRLEEPNQGGGGGGAGELSPWDRFTDAPLEDWAQKIHDNLAAIEAAAGGFVLAMGLILTLSGANIPLGLGLIGIGAAMLAQSISADWSSVSRNVAMALANITMIAGGALLAIGILLALTGANLPLGVALIAAGVASITAGAVINWKSATNNVRTALHNIAFIAGGAMLALGIVLLLATPTFSALGLGLVAAGAATLASEAAENWNFIPPKVREVIGNIMTIGGSLLIVLGLVLALSGAGLPLGLGLIAAGAAGMYSGYRIDNALKQAVTDICDYTWTKVSNLFSGIFKWFDSIIDGAKKVLSWLRGISEEGAARIEADGSIYLTGFASGGHPNTGQLFVANEAGPELVGTMNGQNTVATNADIVAGIRQGVFEAVSAAMNNSNGGEAVVKVYLDGREIRSSQQRVARAMGV